jgi:hypothetical protein
MPWKECSVMDERLQAMAELCREFGISRKTGISITTRPSLYTAESRLSETYGMRNTTRGFPGAFSQVLSTSDKSTVCVAIRSLAGGTASKTFRIE